MKNKAIKSMIIKWLIILGKTLSESNSLPTKSAFQLSNKPDEKRRIFQGSEQYVAQNLRNQLRTHESQKVEFEIQSS